VEVVLERLIKDGVQTIDVIPWFLFPGPHVRRDIPAILDKVCRQYPGVAIHLQEPLGLDPQMLELLARRVQMSANKESR